MADPGTVRLWNDGEGWGVVDSSGTPGGCWAHFSSAAVAGAAHFEAGQPVLLESEPADQDGFHYRAVRFWPEGQEPFDKSAHSSGAAYRSNLTLSFDPPQPQ